LDSAQVTATLVVCVLPSDSFEEVIISQDVTVIRSNCDLQMEKSSVYSEDKFLIQNLQLKLLNMICATLIHEPRYYASAEDTKSVLTALVNQVGNHDPEFIFKLALYVRDDLNIRSTANFLLALAANNKNCHPFFKKYFDATIRLPSDMLEVVTLYMNLEQRYLQGNSVPTVLRKVCGQRFGEFDVYQLAKYNKEKAQKKKTKKQNDKKARNPAALEITPAKPKSITLKQLIRKVHISQPAEPLMSILGKRYPSDETQFQKTGLPGVFNPLRSGKRMKLPTPETWESLLSAKGNKHTTWQELLDHRKLPFMAMLRNLRNVILTGISPEHHDMILNRLTDEKSVTSSRQLPWRFLSAYQAINIDLEQLMNDILDHDGSGEKVIEVKVKGKKGKAMGKSRTIKKRVIIPVFMPDMPLIQKYREAIDTAIRISTMHNIKPISGRTVVFCDVSGSMDGKCSTSGNMGSIQTVKEIAILLGLMLQDVCEECDFRIFSSPSKSGSRCDIAVELKPNTILDNIKRVLQEATKLGGGTDFPFDYLEDLLSNQTKIDNFIILSDMMIAPGHNEMGAGNKTVSSILKRYREKVNSKLLFVAIDLFGNGKSIVDLNCANDKEILITGFSDNILRFISEKGNVKQLEYVQKIDEVKHLNEPKQKKNRKEYVKAEKSESMEL